MVDPLRSSFARLNIGSPCRAKLGKKGPSSAAPRVLPMPLQPMLPGGLRCARFSRKSTPQQRLASLGKTYELMKLLNGILEDRDMDPKVKLNHLRKFQTFHGDVFWMRFGDVKTAERYFDRLNRRIANASTKKNLGTPTALMSRNGGVPFWRRARSTTPKHSK
ncbi:unnamed protein product [Hydatigera taeniaeformis]|uniref:Uncharacterized protein n=1 Tax=Hydatigena taeniaeformis TaxID=6205 RepID=A0A0R3XDG8_HYDTA|nr:unnamed protein product [Hydatigera taeniaeformis]